MFDIGQSQIEVNCDCGQMHIVSLHDVSTDYTIDCNCGRSIRLMDKEGSVGQCVQEINDAVKNLQEAFRRIF